METSINSDFLTDCAVNEVMPPSVPKNKKWKRESTPSLGLSSRGTVSPWDARLILDLALGIEDEEEIISRYDLSLADYRYFLTLPVFRQELAQTMREVRENGITFQRKARIQAENYLEVLDALIYSDNTPSSVRLDGIKQAVIWADLVPKESKDNKGPAGQAVNIQINF